MNIEYYGLQLYFNQFIYATNSIDFFFLFILSVTIKFPKFSFIFMA